jgi:hypothetical protein
LAYLDQRLVLCDFSIRQAVEASGHSLQFASLVQAEQQLWRPTVLTHIRRAQHASVAGKVKDVVGLVHLRLF